MPILSVIVAFHFLHESARTADVTLTVFADGMAHGLPIHWSPFFVVGVIGLARPTNVEDGLRWDSVFSFEALLLDFSSFKIHSGDCFLG